MIAAYTALRAGQLAEQFERRLAHSHDTAVGAALTFHEARLIVRALRLLASQPVDLGAIDEPEIPPIGSDL